MEKEYEEEFHFVNINMLIPSSIHREAKIIAAKKEMTLKEYIIFCIDLTNKR